MLNLTPKAISRAARVTRYFALALTLSVPSYAALAQTVQYDAVRNRLVEPLVGTVLSDDDELSAPTRILLVGGTLAVLDRRADHVIRLYDPITGDRLATFGRHGQGPGEFTGAWDLFRGNSPRSLWVLDVSLRRVTALTVDSLRASQKYRGDALVALSGEGSWESMRQFGVQGFVATGTFTRGRLAQYAPTGAFLRTVGTMPRPAARWGPVVTQDAFAARLGNHQPTNRVVLAYRWTDRIEVRDPQGALLVSMDRPLGFEPLVSDESGSRATFTFDARHAYLSTTSTERNVYALFSGRSEREAGMTMSFGRDVHVFSMDGRLRRILRLDADVMAIAIDDAARELYALAHEPEPRVLRYRIPATPSPPAGPTQR